MVLVFSVKEEWGEPRSGSELRKLGNNSQRHKVEDSKAWGCISLARLRRFDLPQR